MAAVLVVVAAPVDDDLLGAAIDSGTQLGQGEGALAVAGHQAGGDGEADGVAADLAAVGVDGGRGVAQIVVGHGAEAHHQPVAGGELVAEQGADEFAAAGIGEGAGEIEDVGLLGQFEGVAEGGESGGVGGRSARGSSIAGVAAAAAAQADSSIESLRCWGADGERKRGPAPVRRTTPLHNIVRYMF